ncbi:MAG: hypothetical protein N3A54_00015 [Patescibacteria group bacterium]|nr:hypothetical protein [Patescibacteria group bacterium]
MPQITQEKQFLLLEYEKQDIAKIFKEKIDNLLQNIVSNGFDFVYDKFEANLERHKKSLYLFDFPVGGQQVINYFSKLKKGLERISPEERVKRLKDIVWYVNEGALLLLFSVFYKKFPKYMKVFEDNKNTDKINQAMKDSFVKVLLSFDFLVFDDIMSLKTEAERNDYDYQQLIDVATRGVLDYTVKRHLKPSYEEGDLKVYEIETYKECRVLGADTNWCTASSSGETLIKNYLEKGRLFAIFDGDKKYHIFFHNKLLKSDVKMKEDAFKLVLLFVLDYFEKEKMLKYSRKYDVLLKTLKELSNNTEQLIKKDFKRLSDNMNFVFSKDNLVACFQNDGDIKPSIKFTFIPEKVRFISIEEGAPFYENIMTLKTVMFFDNGDIGTFNSIVFLSILYSFFGKDVQNFPMWLDTLKGLENIIMNDLYNISSTKFLFEIKDRRDFPVDVSKAAFIFDLMGKVIPESTSVLSTFSKLYNSYYNKNETYLDALVLMFYLDTLMIEKVIYPIFMEKDIFQSFWEFTDNKNLVLKKVLKMIMDNRYVSLNEYYEIMTRYVGSKMENLIEKAVKNINSVDFYIRRLLVDELEKVQTRLTYEYKEPLLILDKIIHKINLKDKGRTP